MEKASIDPPAEKAAQKMNFAPVRVVDLRCAIDFSSQGAGGRETDEKPGPSGSKWRLLLFATGDKAAHAVLSVENCAGGHGFPCFSTEIVCAVASRGDPGVAPPEPSALSQMRKEWPAEPSASFEIPGAFVIKGKAQSSGCEVRCVVLVCGVSFARPALFRAPALKLPSNPLVYASARDTLGVVGIVNQGATCYMSSLLQSLFHTRLFRAVVYNTPLTKGAATKGGAAASAAAGSLVPGDPASIAAEDAIFRDNEGLVVGAAAAASTGVPPPPLVAPAARRRPPVVHALQRVFAALEGCGSPIVSTKPLTDSFGWNGSEAQACARAVDKEAAVCPPSSPARPLQEQHDVQELVRVLFEHLEQRMAGTPLAQCIPSLFSGKQVSWVDAQHTSRGVFRSTPTTTAFFDLQLPVKDHPNVLSAMREYVADADLSGDNKYQMPDSKEAVDAVKRTRFSALPPVLHLHLMRFTYSSTTGEKVKINSRFEFPELLDMSEFISLPEPSRDNDTDVDCVLGSSSSESQAAPATSDSAVQHCATPAAMLAVEACKRARGACDPALGKVGSPRPALYRLHSVLTHSGTVNSGHYTAYVRPCLGMDESTVHCSAHAVASACSDTAASAATLQRFNLQGVSRISAPHCSDTAAVPVPATQHFHVTPGPIAHRVTAQGDDEAIVKSLAEYDLPSNRFAPGSDFDDGFPCDHRPRALSGAGSTGQQQQQQHQRRAYGGGWYHFDDSSVTAVSESEAIADNFGSDGSGGRGRNAYYLVYVRQDALADLALAGAHPLVFAPGCMRRTCNGGWESADVINPRTGPPAAFPPPKSVTLPVRAAAVENEGGSAIEIGSDSDGNAHGSEQKDPFRFKDDVDAAEEKSSRISGLKAAFCGEKLDTVDLCSDDGDVGSAQGISSVKHNKLGKLASACWPGEARDATTPPLLDDNGSHLPSNSGLHRAISVVSTHVLLLTTTVPMPDEMHKRMLAAVEAEALEEKRRADENRARRRSTLALFHIVTEGHQFYDPVPRGDETTKRQAGGFMVDALPLSRAFRLATRLDDHCRIVWSAVQEKLGLPAGSFLLWAAKARPEAGCLRPAFILPGCAWLPGDDDVQLLHCDREVDALVADEDLNLSHILRGRAPGFSTPAWTSLIPAHPPPNALMQSGSSASDAASEAEHARRLRQWYAGGAWGLQLTQPWSRYFSGQLGPPGHAGCDLPASFSVGDVGHASVASACAAEPPPPWALWSTCAEPFEGWASMAVTQEVVLFLQLLPREEAQPLLIRTPHANFHPLLSPLRHAHLRVMLNGLAWLQHLLSLQLAKGLGSNVSSPSTPALSSAAASADWFGPTATLRNDYDALCVSGPASIASMFSSCPSDPAVLHFPAHEVTERVLRSLAAGGSRTANTFYAGDLVPLHVYRTYALDPSQVDTRDFSAFPAVPRIATSLPRSGGATFAFIGTVLVPVDVPFRTLKEYLARWLGLLPPEDELLQALIHNRPTHREHWTRVQSAAAAHTAQPDAVITVAEFESACAGLNEHRDRNSARSGRLAGTADEDCFATGDVIWVSFKDELVLDWMPSFNATGSIRRDRQQRVASVSESRNTYADVLGLAEKIKPGCSFTSFSVRGSCLDAPHGLLAGDDHTQVLTLPASFTAFTVAPLAASDVPKEPTLHEGRWLGNAWQALAGRVSKSLQDHLSNSVMAQVLNNADFSADLSPYIHDVVREQLLLIDDNAVLRAFVCGVTACSDFPEAPGPLGRLPPLLLPLESSLPRSSRREEVAAFIASELNSRLKNVAAGLHARAILSVARSVRDLSQPPRLGHTGSAQKRQRKAESASAASAAAVAAADHVSWLDAALVKMATDGRSLHADSTTLLPSACLVSPDRVGVFVPAAPTRLGSSAHSFCQWPDESEALGAIVKPLLRGAQDSFALRPPGNEGLVWLWEPYNLAFDLLPFAAKELADAVSLHCHWVGASPDAPAQSFILTASAQLPYSDLLERVRDAIGVSGVPLRLSLYGLTYVKRASLAKGTGLSSLFGASAKSTLPSPPAPASVKATCCCVDLMCVLGPRSTLDGVLRVAKRAENAIAALCIRHAPGLKAMGGAFTGPAAALAATQFVLVAEGVPPGEPPFPYVTVSTPAAPTEGTSRSRLGPQKQRRAKKRAKIHDDDEDDEGSSSEYASLCIENAGRGRGRKRGNARIAVDAAEAGAAAHECGGASSAAKSPGVWIAATFVLPCVGAATPLLAEQPPTLAGRVALLYVRLGDLVSMVTLEAMRRLRVPAVGAAASAAASALSPDTFTPSHASAPEDSDVEVIEQPGIASAAPSLPRALLHRTMAEIIKPWPSVGPVDMYAKPTRLFSLGDCESTTEELSSVRGGGAEAKRLSSGSTKRGSTEPASADLREAAAFSSSNRQAAGRGRDQPSIKRFMSPSKSAPASRCAVTKEDSSNWEAVEQDAPLDTGSRAPAQRQQQPRAAAPVVDMTGSDADGSDKEASASAVAATTARPQSSLEWLAGAAHARCASSSSAAAAAAAAAVPSSDSDDGPPLSVDNKKGRSPATLGPTAGRPRASSSSSASSGGGGGGGGSAGKKAVTRGAGTQIVQHPDDNPWVKNFPDAEVLGSCVESSVTYHPDGPVVRWALLVAAGTAQWPDHPGNHGPVMRLPLLLLRAPAALLPHVDVQLPVAGVKRGRSSVLPAASGEAGAAVAPLSASADASAVADAAWRLSAEVCGASAGVTVPSSGRGKQHGGRSPILAPPSAGDAYALAPRAAAIAATLEAAAAKATAAASAALAAAASGDEAEGDGVMEVTAASPAGTGLARRRSSGGRGMGITIAAPDDE